METTGETKRMTTKFTGFIGLCLFLCLLLVFLDSGFLVWSAAAAGFATPRIFGGGAPLYSIGLAGNAILVVFSAACLVLFWTKRRFVRRLITAFLISVVAVRTFELVLAFLPDVRRASGFPTVPIDTILIKLFLGIVIPVLFIVYLLRPDRKVELAAAPPRSED